MFIKKENFMSLLKDCLTKNVLFWNVSFFFFFLLLSPYSKGLIILYVTWQPWQKNNKKNLIKYFIIFVHLSFFVLIIFKYKNWTICLNFQFIMCAELYNNVMPLISAGFNKQHMNNNFDWILKTLQSVATNILEI